MNEQELVRDAQRGNKEAFGMLYDAYVKHIYDFVYYKTHHKETAEDIVSHVFIKAMRGIEKIDPAKSFKSWIYRIAQNTVIDHYRSRKQHTDIDDAWDIHDESIDIEHDVDTKEKLAKVKKIIETLPQPQRDIVIMRVWQDLSYKEIAEIVGKSERNCMVIYSRAIEKLRDLVPAGLLALLLLKL